MPRYVKHDLFSMYASPRDIFLSKTRLIHPLGYLTNVSDTPAAGGDVIPDHRYGNLILSWSVEIGKEHKDIIEW